MIANGENSICEFKASFKKEVTEIVVAFVNSEVGSIFIQSAQRKKLQLPHYTQILVKPDQNSTQPSVILYLEMLSRYEITVTG